MTGDSEILARSLSDTAKALGMPYQKVHEAAKSKALKSYRVGRRYYVEVADALEWLRSHPTGDTNPEDD